MKRMSKTDSSRDKVCELYKELFYDELTDSDMQAELSILKDILLRKEKNNEAIRKY